MYFNKSTLTRWIDYGKISYDENHEKFDTVL